MRVALRRLAAAATVALGVVIASPAFPGPPSDAVRASLDRLLVVMNDSALKTPERAAERQQALKVLAEDALDFKESARRALGPHWDARTPAEQERFVRLFTALIDHAYLTQLSGGEKVVLDSERVDGAQAVGRGRALSKSGGATPVEFYLDQDANGGWRLYDVSFEGVSLIGNYRAQFNKIIRTSSFEDLANLLEARTRANAQATTDEEPKTATPAAR